jgi:hypothetical protein
MAITPENSYSSSLALAGNGQATAIWLHEPSPGKELIETADYAPAKLSPGGQRVHHHLTAR